MVRNAVQSSLLITLPLLYLSPIPGNLTSKCNHSSISGELGICSRYLSSAFAFSKKIIITKNFHHRQQVGIIFRLKASLWMSMKIANTRHNWNWQVIFLTLKRSLNGLIYIFCGRPTCTLTLFWMVCIANPAKHGLCTKRYTTWHLEYFYNLTLKGVLKWSFWIFGGKPTSTHIFWLVLLIGVGMLWSAAEDSLPTKR